jgi:hypothetical protein
MAAGTATKTETVKAVSVKQIKWVWLSGTAAAPADLGGVTSATTAVLNGEIISVTQIPGGTTPTNLYDVTITDANSVDVLAGLGANLSNAATTIHTKPDGLGAVVNSALTLNVSNAGSAKTGTTIITLR